MNLNLECLKSARLAMWQGVKEGISRRHPGAWTDAVIQRYIDLYESRVSGEYSEYCAVVVYLLRKRLSSGPPIGAPP